METAFVKNSGDEKQIQEGRKNEKKLLASEKENIRSVLATREGRRFVWHVLGRICRIHTQSYVADSDRTAFNDGRRSVGLELIRQVNEADKNAYWKMAQESTEQNDEE